MAQRILIAAAAVALAGCAPAPEGPRAYAEGRFADAHRAFASEAVRAGERAPADLLHDAALAALRAGALKEADALAERAAAAGGAAFAPRVDRLRGHAAFLRSARDEAEASGPRADATGWDRAIRHAVAARDHWILAAVASPGDPGARRNAERAVLRLEDLARKRAAAARATAGGGRPKVVLLPDPSSNERPADGRPRLEDAAPGAVAGDLPAGRVLGVLDRLAEEERAKRALRLAHRRASGGGTERDW